MAPRYACPPWFECACGWIGKPVCLRTMRTHRNVANRRRRALHRGTFRWGPKIPEGVEKYTFLQLNSLADHESEDEVIALHDGGDDEDGNLDDSGCVEGENSEAAASASEWRGEQEDNIVAGSVFSSFSYFPPYSMGCMENVGHEAYSTGRRAISSSVDIDDHDKVDTDMADLPPDVVSGSSLGNVEHLYSEGEHAPIPHVNSVEEGYGTDVATSSHGSTISRECSEDEEDFGSRGSRVPGLMDWIYANQKCLEYYQKHGTTITAMEDLLELFEAPCQTWKTVVNNVLYASGISGAIEEFPMCPGHMAFVDLIEEANDGVYRDRCTCGSTAADVTDIFRSLPLLPRLRSIVGDEDACREFYEYRSSRESATDVLRDYYDGTGYKRLCERFGGDEGMKYDVFVGLSADGFQAFKNKRCDVWLISALNFNLAPHLRYKAKNFLPIAFVPGPNQPQDMQSFLIPFLNEIWRTHHEIVTMKFYDGVVRRVRIHLLYFSGDQQAISKCAGLVGYNGKSPCRSCKIHGEYGIHYYFPSRILDGDTLKTLFDIRALPYRSSVECYDTFDKLGRLSGAPLREYKKNTGIREGSVLFCLPGIEPYESFPQDIMHTFQNVQRELLRLMKSDMYEDGFTLSAEVVRRMDEEMLEWGMGIAGELATKPRKLSNSSDWKAAEYKHFTLSYCLVLFDGYLEHEYMNGLQKFVEVVEICSAPIILRSDIARLRRSAIEFVDHYETHWFRFRPERVSFCKSIIHAILHLADCTERFGPLCGVSQYWLEREIGWHMGKLNARTRPAESMFRSACFAEAHKILFNKPISKDDNVYGDVAAGGGIRMMGPTLVRKVSEMGEQARSLSSLLAGYLTRTYSLPPAEARGIAGDVSHVTLHSRMRYLCGSSTSVAGAFWSLLGTQPRKPYNRPMQFVAVEMDSTDSTADVYYGRVLRIMEVRLGGVADEEREWHGRHELVWMDWGMGLSAGAQGQVFKVGRASNAFWGGTIESATIVKRLISVIEHNAPSQVGNYNRTQKRTYFCDNNSRMDRLLSLTMKSSDGVNRRLKGMARRR